MRWMMMGLVVTALAGCSRSQPAGPVERVRAFAATDTPITTSGVTAEDDGWRIDRSGPGSVPLFEVSQGTLENTILTYRARMKVSDVKGKVYLEMWVRVPGKGEFFSRGLAQPLTGTSGWASYEIPFFLNEKGVRADLVKLNVAFDGGGGTVWMKDVELLRAPVG